MEEGKEVEKKRASKEDRKGKDKGRGQRNWEWKGRGYGSERSA